MDRVLYRIVKTNPPTVADFTSNQALHRGPRRITAEVLRLWDGISTHDSPQQSRQMAGLFPLLGSYIAELRIPAGAPVRCERTLTSEGHYTLWGEPLVLLACVVSVVQA